MEKNSESPEISRLGFHYAADTLHYRQKDLQLWLPELKKLGAGWLTLLAPAERAIPETFLSGLLAEGVQPILQFNLPVALLRPGDGLQLLFNHYANLGVRYVTLYDRPNIRQSWSAAIWAQTDLVERFLDQYIPLADLAVMEGLTPVFPPLEPGGDYWDLAFLRAALESLQRRGCQRLLDVMALGAYARAGNRPLAWGAGGPQRWPGARPYAQQAGMQDQRGFLVFEWYQEICQKVLGRRLRLVLFEAGSKYGDNQDHNYPAVDGKLQADRNLALIEWLHGERIIFGLDAKPAPEVLACNFWLLQAEKNQPEYRQAWFRADGKNLPVITEFYRWAASRRGDLLPAGGADTPAAGNAPEAVAPVVAAPSPQPPAASEPVKPQQPQPPTENDTAQPWEPQKPAQPQPPAAIQPEIPEDKDDLPANPAEAEAPSPDVADLLVEEGYPSPLDQLTGEEKEDFAVEIPAAPAAAAKTFHSIAKGIMAPQDLAPINHYVLLPLYSWGVADWDMDLILPLLQETHPTIGFSLAEARMAQRVTVVGGKEAISDKAIDSLRQAGCSVERLTSDGTLVAT